MASLKDTNGNAVPATRDPFLNSCQGTILVPSSICLGDRPWDKCSTLVKSILSLQDITALHVDCYVIPPVGRRQYPARIAKVQFDTRTPPDAVIIAGTRLHVKPSIPVPRQCRQCWKYGHPAKHCRSAAACRLCASLVHTEDSCPKGAVRCVNCGGSHPASSRSCPLFVFEAKVLDIQRSDGLRRRDARQEARRLGFSFTRRLYSAATASAQTSSGPPSSASTQTLPTTTSVSASTLPSLSSAFSFSVPVSNSFALLNPFAPTSLPSSSSFSASSGHESVPSSSSCSAAPRPQRRRHTKPLRSDAKRSLSDSPETISKVVKYLQDTAPSGLSDHTMEANGLGEQQETVVEVHSVPDSLPPTPVPPLRDVDVDLSSDDVLSASPQPIPSADVHSDDRASLLTSVLTDAHMSDSTTPPSAVPPSPTVSPTPIEPPSTSASSCPTSLALVTPISPLQLPMPPGYEHLRIPTTSDATSPISTVITL